MTKILVVDDDLALADVLAFTLRRAGFDVLLSHDGQNALEEFAREKPDLIVLDWMLPASRRLDRADHYVDSSVWR
jgi:DNA-binding response OmpR family regulator